MGAKTDALADAPGALPCERLLHASDVGLTANVRREGAAKRELVVAEATPREIVRISLAKALELTVLNAAKELKRPRVVVR